MPAVKKPNYASLIITLIMLFHIIRSICIGYLSLPGHDVYLAVEPARFWVSILFLLSVASFVLIKFFTDLNKTKKD